MKMKILFLAFWLVSFAGFSQSKTLELIPASADEFSNSEISLSWTIGEGIIETFSNESLTLTQGFLQPNLKVTALNDIEQNAFEVRVYPNPTPDLLNFEYDLDKEQGILVQLYDLSGKVLYSKSFHSASCNESIDMKGFSSSLFILKISSLSGDFIETYKIQRIK
jgi:hypothetical protein